MSLTSKTANATHTHDFYSCQIVIAFHATELFVITFTLEDLDHRQVKIFNLLNIFWAWLWHGTEGNRQVSRCSESI